MSKQAIKSKIDQHIKENGKSQITGPVLNDILTDIVNDYPTDDEVITGITGDAELNTQPSSTKFERWTASLIGTYVNFRDKDGNPITIIKEELDEFDIVISVTNGVAKKNFSKKKDSKTETWEAKEYKKGRQVFHKGAIYEAVVDTQSTDIPGKAPNTVWELKLQGVLITSGNKSLVKILDASGNHIAKWDENGNLETNYGNNIIPESAVKGLAIKLRDFSKSLSTLSDAVQFRMTSSRVATGSSYFKYNLRSDVASFVDTEMKKYISVDEYGEVFINKLRVNSIRNSSIDNAEKYPVFEGTEIAIPEQTMLYIDFIYGALPTDNSPARAVTKQVAVLKDSKGKLIAILNTTLSIQGNYSSTVPKKGYSIDLFNKDGKDVSLKIGDRPPLKGFHLKAYQTDFTQTRDVGAGRLWQTFIQSNVYPYNHYKTINPIRKPNTLDFEQFSADAQYALLGIPCEVRVSGRFEGLYTWRTKKTDPVYAINSKRATCISIESQGDPANVIPVALGSYAYANFEEVATAYEIRSPKAKNITQVTKDKVMRFFRWCNQVYSGALTNQQVRDTHANYLNLPHWVDWIIIAEFLLHWDSIHNNSGYISYDGDHFSPVLIDCDHTLDNDGNRSGYIDGSQIISEDIFGKLKVIFLPEIKTRYTELRKSGVLSNQSIKTIYGGISKGIPWNVYVNDFKKWNNFGWWWGSSFVPSMDMIYDVSNRRLRFLDSIWLNP
ncbi:CotH kinase family protein [Elizabethkingia anophelis]|uniref:CotH kinase family protein n=1 Tax=Elizabethkingia anophelis TaxID=1117645 RepID=UPI00222755E7|nr:CotH kinase family protein [Elizabethkingia anophelis]MCW2463356.1 hypothetical protein [Elizabethkingia anophelis]MCW2467041.1 hypothetical protein [Elizabethkingia anophelis]MCW2470811.1 hypothetical protein [Elizabethkingia anophelis]HBI9690683.1 CotH kinase family protein [Elizabethkingia anophelis]HBI9694702.1 CotH kinase family protein [Elizabethkingia anophelis]